MSTSRRRLGAGILVPLLIAACGSSTPSAGPASDATSNTTLVTDAATTVAPTDAPTTTLGVGHVRGTAYTFNTPDPIVGATVEVEELPGVSATTGADGSYELTVPLGATVTPFIEATGHHTMHVQTFSVSADGDGAEIDGVNFQTPSDAIYDGLKALVKGVTGRDPFESGCVIVSTVGDKKLVGMNFAEFIAFHPHGVAGATASIDPAVATPLYFNEQVLPDKAQATTSADGGVLWTNVPPGSYTLSAAKAGTRFVQAHVRCGDGWVVNANPVWGLHEVP